VKLPLLVTVPHGGRDVPPEAASCLLGFPEIAEDGDTWSRELYALGDQVNRYVDTQVPRAVVDLNRAPDDLPPANPDGVVKTCTVNGTQVWPDATGPDPELVRLLLDRYHAPWHQAVSAAASEPGLELEEEE